jgi:hypothetical protein
MMKSHPDNRRPHEIEGDIARTRADVSNTIDAIQSKLSPGELMNEALQLARQSGAREFTQNFGRSMRDNPIPVALVGIGLAWLMTTSRRGPPAYREELAYRSDLGWADTDRTSTGAGATGDRGEGLIERTRAGAAGLGHRVRDSVSGAADLGHRVKESVTGATQHVRELGHDVRLRAGDLTSRSRMQVDRARESTMRLIDEQPLVLGAIGLAVGAALGAALPSTRREDALLGEARDDLLDTARGTARESLRTVGDSARKLADTARTEVERVLDSDETPTAESGDTGRDLSGGPTGTGRPRSAATP